MTLRWSCKQVALLWLTGSFIVHSQYHGCWCPGDASGQGIGSHNSDLCDFSGSVPYGLRLAASNVILYCQLNEHKLFDTVFYWWFLFITFISTGGQLHLIVTKRLAYWYGFDHFCYVYNIKHDSTKSLCFLQKQVQQMSYKMSGVLATVIPQPSLTQASRAYGYDWMVTSSPIYIFSLMMTCTI